MEIDSRQWRFCKAIACDKLEGMSCTVEECEHPDKAEALTERRRVLWEVKHGGNS